MEPPVISGGDCRDDGGQKVKARFLKSALLALVPFMDDCFAFDAIGGGA